MYREEKTDKLITLLTGILLTAALAFLVIFKTGIVFETNDDATLRNIASGAFTGKPDAHLIYIMYPLGLILKALYTVASKINWYDYLMVSLHFACLFLVLVRVGDVVKSMIYRIAAMLGTFLLLFAVELKFFVLHQYTELAGLIGATALLYLGTYDYKKKRKSDIVLIIVLLMITLWLRKQVLFICLPFAVLLILLSIFETKDTMDSRFDRLKSVIAPTAVFAALLAVSFAIEFFAYSQPEWKTFKEFNEARTTVYDYNMLADYDSNRSFYDSIGISEEEYTVLREYGLVLMEDIDSETLLAIAEKAEENAKEWAQYYSVPRKIIIDTLNALLSYASNPIVFICIVLLVVLGVQSVAFDDKVTALILVCNIVYMVSFVALFTYKERLPERVSQGFFLMELLFCTAVLIRLFTKQRNLRMPDFFWTILAGLCIFAFVACLDFYAYRQTNDRLAEKEEATVQWVELNKYFKENQDKVFVINNAVFATAGDVLFKEGTTDSFNIVTGNWTLGGPLFEERNDRILTSSVQKSLMEEENVYYVQNAGKNTEWLSDYFGSAKVIETITIESGASYDIISVSR